MNCKWKKNIDRTRFVIILLSLILLATGCGSDASQSLSWEELSKRPLSEWEELIENGVGQKLDISTVDKDIKITAEGIIADELNTIIVLKIEDLKGENRLTPDWDFTPESRPIYLSGEILRSEELAEDMSPIINHSPLYSEEDNITRLMIRTNAINREKGNIDIHINRLIGVLDLYEKSGIEVEGNWDLTIPVEFIESETYTVNKIIELDGNKVNIREITIGPTATNIEYGLERYNKEEGYFINDVTFLIKVGNKTYEGSKLISKAITAYSESGYLTGSYNIKSLFLENPKNIDLIINTYEIDSEGSESYDIDWDNLPQEVEYKESKITIESIEYREGSTEVIIKEDDSRNRKYNSSKFAFRIEEDEASEEIDIDYIPEYRNILRSNIIDWEIRDSRGRKVDKYATIWKDEYYAHVIKQELVLSEENFKVFDINPDRYKEYLIPEKLYIDGQIYKLFPNIRTNINLK